MRCADIWVPASQLSGNGLHECKALALVPHPKASRRWLHGCGRVYDCLLLLVAPSCLQNRYLVPGLAQIN